MLPKNKKRIRILTSHLVVMSATFAAADVAAAVEIFAAAAGAPLLQPQVTEELRR